MTPDSQAKPGLLADVAIAVQRRLFLQGTLRLLGRTSWWIALAGVLVLVAGRLLHWPWSPWLAAAILLLAWAGIAAVIAWVRKPDLFHSLAIWDRTAGRAEMIASAWWFETLGNADESDLPGTKLHVDAAHGLLATARAEIPRDLPLKVRGWWPPLLLLVLSLLPVLRLPVAAEDQLLVDSALDRARNAAADIAKVAKLNGMEGLSQEEQKRIETLKISTEKTIQRMAKPQTARKLLTELEERAKEAEALAAAMGEMGDQLSGGMLNALESQTDTADLGDALRSEDPGKIAKAAEKLAEQLNRKDLFFEEKERIRKALAETMRAATAKDKDSATGKALSSALSSLQDGQPGAAGQAFSKLSSHFKNAAMRRAAQMQLRQLANQLRSSGQQIVGGGASRLQSIAVAPPGQAPAGLTPLQPGAMPFSRPGTLQLAPNAPGNAGGQAPIATAIPVPGLPGQAAPNPGAQMGVPAGGFPIPGSGAGGFQAGRGTAPFDKPETIPVPASQTGVVASAKLAAESGPSSFRSVEGGGGNRETAERSPEEVAKEFIKVEEEALDAEPLPVSRRQQVLRYLTALREHLNSQPKPIE